MIDARPPRSLRGFTVIEMMITIAIVLVILALAAPSFRTFLQNAQIRTAAESTQAGLHFAKSEALRRNTRVTYWAVNDLTSGCSLSNGGKSWVVSIANPASACNETPEAHDAEPDTYTAHRIFQTRSSNEGSPDINVVANSSCITFNGFGRIEATCPGGGAPISSIAITSTAPNTRTLNIRVSSGGSIRMCNPAVLSVNDPAYCGP